MKTLLINGKQALIDINQYFPFTYMISDLEEINIINFPSTKSVMLPRNTVNDDLFGNIAEITRRNFGYDDGQSGVSFNQFKKANYTLMYFSEIVSEGLLRIVNITDTHYEVELYDKAIELLEELEDRELNELEIINPQTSKPLEDRLNHQSIKNMLTQDWGITPVFVNTDSKYTGTKIYGNQEGVGEKVLELPKELTPLQMRTFSAADIPFAIQLTKVMDMVERHRVEFSPYVKSLLSQIYMLLKRPKNGLASKETKMRSDTATKNADDKDLLVWHNYNWLEESGSWYMIFNGEYQVKYEYDFTVTTTQAGDIITQYDGQNYTDSNTSPGSPLGVLAVDTSVFLMGGGFSQATFTKIPLYKDRNAFYSKSGNTRTLRLKGSFITSMKIYQKWISGSTMRVYHSFSGRRWGAGDNTYKGKDLNLFGFLGDSGKFSVNSKITPIITHKHLDFTEYDLLDSKKLLPNISIKDFIINIAKTFNLNISVKDNYLFIDVKKYYMSEKSLVIDDKLDIDVSKVNFSRLEIKNITPQSPLIDEYEEEYKTWASKIVNTGYSIKKEDEEIELPYGTPFALTDYNFFAYDLFGLYLNGGYARYPIGSVNDVENELIFGYLNINDETMYVTDAEYINDEFIISNKKLTRQDGANGVEWVFADGDNENVSTLNNYPTLLPYLIRDGNVIESLEVNKPHYNFANITDAQYPESSTLYNRFHKNMLEDKFNANTHVLSGKMLIDDLSVINKIFNYKNSNYIISELIEYDPTTPDMYEVKLMRVNDTTNYTTVPPLQPKKLNIILEYTINSFFEGDVRTYGNSLGGHDTQLLMSINDEPYEVVQDVTDIIPTHEFENNETKVKSIRTYSAILDGNNSYKFKTQQKMRYKTDNTQKEMIIPDSSEYTILNTSWRWGTLLTDTTPHSLVIETNPNTVAVHKRSTVTYIIITQTQ